MVKVSLSLLRKRAEHNDGKLSDLEEVSLHQQDLTDLGQLPVWCPRLKILLLQGNLLNQLGKVGRLRDLKYINLALNNLEDLSDSSLGDCEALTKVDLTANFLADLTGTVDTLQKLSGLVELYLNGNPCCDYPGYREYVITRLVWLQELDGVKIKHLERVKAWKEFNEVEIKINEAQSKALVRREREKKQATADEEYNSNLTTIPDDDETQLRERWQHEESGHNPETRLAMSEELRRLRHRKHDFETDTRSDEKKVKLFNRHGEPLNVNEAKINFKFVEDEEHNEYVLTVYAYRHLDPSLLECDVEPKLVRVKIKGKVLQLALPEEVYADTSKAKRSQATGHLLVTMPKVSRCPYKSIAEISARKNRKSENLILAQRSFTTYDNGENDLINKTNVRYAIPGQNSTVIHGYTSTNTAEPKPTLIPGLKSTGIPETKSPIIRRQKSTYREGNKCFKAAQIKATLEDDLDELEDDISVPPLEGDDNW